MLKQKRGNEEVKNDGLVKEIAVVSKSKTKVLAGLMALTMIASSAAVLSGCTKPETEVPTPVPPPIVVPNPETKQLFVPANLKISEDEKSLSWDVVENASAYVVSVDGAEVASSANTFSIENLTEPKIYEFKVKAIGKVDGYITYSNSNWSQPINFEFEAVPEIAEDSGIEKASSEVVNFLINGNETYKGFKEIVMNELPAFVADSQLEFMPLDIEITNFYVKDHYVNPKSFLVFDFKYKDAKINNFNYESSIQLNFSRNHNFRENEFPKAIKKLKENFSIENSEQLLGLFKESNRDFVNFNFTKSYMSINIDGQGFEQYFIENLFERGASNANYIDKSLEGKENFKRTKISENLISKAKLAEGAKTIRIENVMVKPSKSLDAFNQSQNPFLEFQFSTDNETYSFNVEFLKTTAEEKAVLTKAFTNDDEAHMKKVFDFIRNVQIKNLAVENIDVEFGIVPFGGAGLTSNALETEIVEEAKLSSAKVASKLSQTAKTAKPAVEAKKPLTNLQETIKSDLLAKSVNISFS